MNLTVNARDAMPGGGTLSISVGRENGFVKLRVVDDGAGMEPEVAARAFDPLFTTKEKGRGTGLGLATVYGVVQQAGVRELTGRILAESGYRILRAPDGRHARELVQEHGNEIDLLLSDVVMPGMSGPEVAKELRRLCPGLKVLFMSGHAGTCSATTVWPTAGYG